MVALAQRFTQLLVAAILFVGCQSTPSLARTLIVAPGELTTVRLIQVKGHLAFSLQNGSGQAPDQVYTANSNQIDPGSKVIADAELQALLDVFSELGLFAASLDEVPHDALDALIVEQGGQRWVWVRRQLGVQAAEQSFHDARAAFLTLFNSSVAYHGTGTERPNFKAEDSRARQDAARAREHLRARGTRR